MYVCVCKGISDTQLEQAVAAGVDNVRQACRSTGLGTQCGKCVCFARERIEHHRQQRTALAVQVA